MLRGIYKYGLALCLCLTVSLLWAQKKTDRDYLRSGNRLYRDSMYTKAEVDYRKAIEANSRFPQAHFNLGNALLRQQKPKEAMQAYEQAVKVETNKGRLASIYHNMGVAYAGMFMYDKAAESFKLAYETGQYSESYDAYLAAKYFDERNKELIVEDVSDRELAVRKHIESVMDNARYQEEYRKLEELVKRKEHGDVAYYHKAVKGILSSWKDEYRGYSARDN